jgi:DNA-binding MarR family transcriptional regulator
MVWLNGRSPSSPAITNIDRLIHEPARLAIVSVLSACESADFKALLRLTGLTKGNLSAQLQKLEQAEYITITKGFKGRYPHTDCALTPAGRRAFRNTRRSAASSTWGD